MGTILDLGIAKSERKLPSDKAKLEYLENRLFFYRGLELVLAEADSINYDFRVTSHDGNVLWVGGAHGQIGGMACGSRSGATPYFSFIQDIAVLRVLLELTDLKDPDVENFHTKLLDYAAHLYGNGWIAEPAVKANPSDPESVRNAVDDLRFAQLGHPAGFVANLETQYTRLVLEKKGLKGQYNPSHIVEDLAMKIHKK